MSEEEFKKLCDDLDKRIVLHQAIKEPISQDLDSLIKLSVAYEKLQQENQQLDEHIEVLRNKFDKYKRTISPKKLLEEHDLYKSVLDEIREYLETKDLMNIITREDGEYVSVEKSTNELLQILDKVGSNESKRNV